MRRFERVMLAVSIVTLSAPSMAQTPRKDTGETLIEAVTRCRSITGPTERLACFDRASSALETARASNDIAVLSREEVAEKRRSLFGFQLPTTNLFGRAGEKMPDIQKSGLDGAQRRAFRPRSLGRGPGRRIDLENRGGLALSPGGRRQREDQTRGTGDLSRLLRRHPQPPHRPGPVMPACDLVGRADRHRGPGSGSAGGGYRAGRS